MAALGSMQGDDNEREERGGGGGVTSELEAARVGRLERGWRMPRR